jgi:hypothetical protein
MRWRTYEVEPGPALTCVCCGELVPDEDAVVSEWLYVLDAYDTSDEKIEAFSKAFELPDPLADFHICRECLHRYGSVDKDSDPMEWLETYLGEDSKLISRQEALRIVEDWT